MVACRRAKTRSDRGFEITQTKISDSIRARGDSRMARDGYRLSRWFLARLCWISLFLPLHDRTEAGGFEPGFLGDFCSLRTAGATITHKDQSGVLWNSLQALWQFCERDVDGTRDGFLFVILRRI